VHLDHVADQAFVDQSLGRDMRRVPGDRPIDGQPASRPVHGCQHPARVADARRKRLFHKDVQSMRRDLFDGVGVLSGRRTHDREISLGAGQAGLQVGEDALVRYAEPRDSGLHAGTVRVEYAGDFRARMFGHLAQKVAHVHVVEADSQDAVSRHSSQTSSGTAKAPGAL
jgi:hypothetical protein